MNNTLISIAMAAFWTTFMVWWSADFSAVNIIIFTGTGLAFGFLWTFFMRRWGYLT
jgi:hypothetical protein